ncbi:MAG: hypothetical protein LUQ11_12590 [Methylococcaceae bacterium]|nr:hypothetical protein [Methylococcaceae bacterium]
MEQTLLIILMEVLLVALVALIALLYLNWRKTMHCHAALERMFDDVKERQGLRSDGIVSYLTGQYHMNKQSAQELVATLFSAETLFLAEFIERQLRQQSVDGFYQNLCDLLDSYLQAKPEKVVEAKMSDETAKDSAKNTLAK